MEFENTKIGKEQPPIQAKKVRVLGLSEECVKFDQKDSLKLVLKVSHPDVGELEISKVKYQKGDKLSVAGLWLTKDNDGCLPYNSAVAHLLRAYNIDSIVGLTSCELDTVLDEAGYLIIKGY